MFMIFDFFYIMLIQENSDLDSGLFKVDACYITMLVLIYLNGPLIWLIAELNELVITQTGKMNFANLLQC